MTEADIVLSDTTASMLVPLPERKPATVSLRLTPYLLMAPLIILLIAFTILPAVLTTALAFFDVDILAGIYHFVGWTNFTRAAGRGEIANSVKVTFLYAAWTVPPSLFFGLLAALAINALTSAAAFWRAIYFLPVAATLVAMSIVWRWMFLAQKGVVDAAAGQFFGLTDWLNSPHLALQAVAIVGNWQQIGFVTILYLAALASVPSHALEAARVDGAGRWNRFWHIT